MMVLSILLAILAAWGWRTSPQDFFHAWLLGFVFWLGIAQGGLILRLTHSLSAGRWGDTIRPQLRASGRCFPWLALLSIPVMLGVGHLYAWSQANTDAVLQHQRVWMNVPAFVIRMAVYFAAWIAMDRWDARLSQAYEASGEVAILDRLQTRSGLLLAAEFVVSTLASIDWLMALIPHWYSTQFGFLVISTQALSGLSLSIVGVASSAAVTRERLYDVGSMLLVFVMLMCYLAYGQWIIIWSGDLPHESIYYRQRLVPGWDVQGGLVVLGMWALPFTLLIFGRFKENRIALRALSVWLLAMTLVWLHWVIEPSYRPGWWLSWMDVMVPLAMGCWLYWPYRYGAFDYRPTRTYHMEEALHAV